MLSHDGFETYLQELVKVFYEREERIGDYRQDKWEWDETELRDAFSSIILRAGKYRRIIVYVDALDECGEAVATALVEYFEDPMVEAELSEARLKVCFSCRHYPIITTLSKGYTIIMDGQNIADLSLVVRRRLSKTKLNAKTREAIG